MSVRVVEEAMKALLKVMELLKHLFFPTPKLTGVYQEARCVHFRKVRQIVIAEKGRENRVYVFTTVDPGAHLFEPKLADVRWKPRSVKLRKVRQAN